MWNLTVILHKFITLSILFKLLPILISFWLATFKIKLKQIRGDWKRETGKPGTKSRVENAGPENLAPNHALFAKWHWRLNQQ